MAINVAQNLHANAVGVLMDDRTQISTLSEMENIENPHVGLIVYCLADKSHYKVTGLNDDQDTVTSYEKIAPVFDVTNIVRYSGSTVVNVEDKGSATYYDKYYSTQWHYCVDEMTGSKYLLSDTTMFGGGIYIMSLEVNVNGDTIQQKSDLIMHKLV